MCFKNFILFAFFIFLPKIFAIDMDYYFSSPDLRSKSITCGRFNKMYCQIKCGDHNGLCIDKQCYCLDITPAGLAKGREAAPHELKFDFDDNDEEIDAPVSKNNPNDNLLYAMRPTVRHHIAHFCPNLDVARECIRKCIKVGKPAFCGKDHICYCGHSYTHMEDDPKVPANKIYAQFKDMYAKYFGTGDQSKLGSDE